MRFGNELDALRSGLAGGLVGDPLASLRESIFEC